MFKGSKSIAVAVVMSVSGAFITQASAQDDASSQLSQDQTLSKSDARNIVRDYLKSKKKYRGLTIGEVYKSNEKWRITLMRDNGVKVAKIYVDYKTGEITFKR